MNTKTNVTDVDLDELRNADRVVSEIIACSQIGRAISYRWFRGAAGRDHGLWSELGRGRSVLVSQAQLDQYLYSYGPMIACQWQEFLRDLEFTPGAINLVDYGCGQGLAGLLLFDRFGQKFFDMLRRIVLIEPSPFALVRAEAVYSAIAPKADIVCVNKAFDDLRPEDLAPEAGVESLHIFSNVLDIAEYDHRRVFDLLLQPGKHCIFAVSSDRDCEGGNSRIVELKEAVEAPETAKTLGLSGSELKIFRCGPGDKYGVISWIAFFEVPYE